MVIEVKGGNTGSLPTGEGEGEGRAIAMGNGEIAEEREDKRNTDVR